MKPDYMEVCLTSVCLCFLLLTNSIAIEPEKLRSTDEERLLHHLFSTYNPAARPVLNSSSTVTVTIQFSLMHIKDLDIRSQIFTTTGLLILEWTDERLTWDPADHNDIQEIIIEAKVLWKPEFAVINGAEKIYEEYNQFRAVISNRGLVHWEPGGVFKTMCEIDITYYPFDEQECELTFGAWSYHTNKMNLTTSTEVVNLDSYKKNGEWEILSTTARRNEFSYECCPNERFSNAAFTVYLRRRHLFYVMNVIMPSIMTSVLLLSIFFCTPAQKVQIGVVVLLSFRIFLLNVAGNIPKTSDHTPLLVIYLTCTLAITTMSMVLTVLVLNLYGINDRPVPPWVKSLVLVWMARLLGMCETANAYQKISKSKALLKSQKINRNTSSGTVDMYLTSPTTISGNGLVEMRPPRIVSSNPSTETLHDPVCVRRRTSLPVPLEELHVSTVEPSPVVEEKRPVPPPAVQPQNKAEFAKDWTRVAEIFDRLFFWLFLMAITFSTLALFHPLFKIFLNSP